MSQLKDRQRKLIFPYAAFYSVQTLNRWDGVRLWESTLFYSVSNSDVNFMQKHPHRHIQNNMARGLGPVMVKKLTITVSKDLRGWVFSEVSEADVAL